MIWKRVVGCSLAIISVQLFFLFFLRLVSSILFCTINELFQARKVRCLFLLLLCWQSPTVVISLMKGWWVFCVSVLFLFYTTCVYAVMKCNNVMLDLSVSLLVPFTLFLLFCFIFLTYNERTRMSYGIFIVSGWL